VVTRGDVWLVNLDPTVGSEIRKSRPCVVLSPPELHDHLKTVIIAPMTSQGFQAPFRVPIRFQGTAGLVVLDQIRSVDKIRMVKKLGSVQAQTLKTALQTMREMFET